MSHERRSERSPANTSAAKLPFFSSSSPTASWGRTTSRKGLSSSRILRLKKRSRGVNRGAAKYVLGREVLVMAYVLNRESHLRQSGVKINFRITFSVDYPRDFFDLFCYVH